MRAPDWLAPGDPLGWMDYWRMAVGLGTGLAMVGLLAFGTVAGFEVGGWTAVLATAWASFLVAASLPPVYRRVENVASRMQVVVGVLGLAAILAGGKTDLAIGSAVLGVAGVVGLVVWRVRTGTDAGQ